MSGIKSEQQMRRQVHVKSMRLKGTYPVCPWRLVPAVVMVATVVLALYRSDSTAGSETTPTVSHHRHHHPRPPLSVLRLFHERHFPPTLPMGVFLIRQRSPGGGSWHCGDASPTTRLCKPSSASTAGVKENSRQRLCASGVWLGLERCQTCHSRLLYLILLFPVCFF